MERVYSVSGNFYSLLVFRKFVSYCWRTVFWHFVRNADYTILNKKSSLQPGITFTSKKIQQYAVVLLGFGLNLSVVLETGRQSLPIILSTISTSLILAFALHAPDRKRATKIRIFVHCYFSLLYIFVTIIVKILTICQRIRYGILL